MEESVVAGARSTAKGFVVAFETKLDGVTEAECTADFEFPVIEGKSGLLGG